MGKRKADLLLVFVTACWGSSSMLTKLGLGEIGPFNLMTLRFLIAFVLSALVVAKRFQKTENLRLLIARSAVLGFILFATNAFNNFGVK